MLPILVVLAVQFTASVTSGQEIHFGSCPTTVETVKDLNVTRVSLFDLCTEFHCYPAYHFFDRNKIRVISVHVNTYSNALANATRRP